MSFNYIVKVEIRMTEMLSEKSFLVFSRKINSSVWAFELAIYLLSYNIHRCYQMQIHNESLRLNHCYNLSQKSSRRKIGWSQYRSSTDIESDDFEWDDGEINGIAIVDCTKTHWINYRRIIIWATTFDILCFSVWYVKNCQQWVIFTEM